jgi:hypothetical protein
MTQANRRTQLVACVLLFEAGHELHDAGGRRCSWALVTLHLRLRANGEIRSSVARAADKVFRCGADEIYRGDAVTRSPGAARAARSPGVARCPGGDGETEISFRGATAGSMRS